MHCVQSQQRPVADMLSEHSLLSIASPPVVRVVGTIQPDIYPDLFELD